MEMDRTPPNDTPKPEGTPRLPPESPYSEEAEQRDAEHLKALANGTAYRIVLRPYALHKGIDV
jgi:hypothetical protein